jgi:hypothetical protein
MSTLEPLTSFPRRKESLIYNTFHPILAELDDFSIRADAVRADRAGSR